MKKYRLIFILVVASFVLIIFNGGLAFADELKGSTGGSLNALDSGYAIARWTWDSGDLFPGGTATVRAYTTEYPTATQVVFRWNSPDSDSVDVGPKPLIVTDDTWEGLSLRYAEDSRDLFDIGNWGVQALFLDAEGNLQGPNPYPIVKIRAISYHVTPEVPFGTIATILTMLGALGVFSIVSRRSSPF